MTGSGRAGSRPRITGDLHAPDIRLQKSGRNERFMRIKKRIQPRNRICQYAPEEQTPETASLTVSCLKSRSGESLAEALVAVLIMAFGALMLASMVQSSTRIVQTSNTGMTKVYNAEAEAEKFLEGTGSSPATESVSSGTVAVTGTTGAQFTQIGGTKLDSSGSGVQIYHDAYSNITVFRKPAASGSGTTESP